MTAERTTTDERRLATRTTVLLVALAAAAGVTAGSVVGPGAALSAVIGVGLVAILFGVSVGLLVWAADRDRGAAIGVFVAGAGVRLGVYVVVLGALSTLGWVHRPSLAAATGIALVVTITAELVWLARMPRLFWVDAEAARPTALPHATRS